MRLLRLIPAFLGGALIGFMLLPNIHAGTYVDRSNDVDAACPPQDQMLQTGPDRKPYARHTQLLIARHLQASDAYLWWPELRDLAQTSTVPRCNYASTLNMVN
jgi:hypothetical protein